MEEEERKVYTNRNKIECAFRGARFGDIRCKLFGMETLSNRPIEDIEIDCLNVHPSIVHDIQFSADMGGDHAILKIEFNRDDIECISICDPESAVYNHTFLECKAKDDTIIKHPEHAKPEERW